MTPEQRATVEQFLAFRAARPRQPVDGEKVRCDQCGGTHDLEYHHRQRWSEGGGNDPENITILCSNCHTRHHSQRGDYRADGRWGGLVSAVLRERRAGGPKAFSQQMRELSHKRRVMREKYTPQEEGPECAI